MDMAILQSCCCWKSVRKGSYASAIYTATYFGIMLLVMPWFVYEEQELLEGEAVGTTKRPMTTSFLEPEGISETSVTFSIVVLACACCGILSSAILICGLYIDNRLLLIPWIVVVICTSLVDLSHIVYLIVLETMKFNPATSILFTIDFFLITTNIYSLLCVVSQYQEYKAGRGTAQYDESRVVNRLPMIRYEAPTRRTPSGVEEGDEERRKRCQKRVQFPEEGERQEEDSRGAVVFLEGGGWPPVDGQSAMLMLSSTSVTAAAAVVVAADTAPLLSPKPTASAPPFFAHPRDDGR